MADSKLKDVIISEVAVMFSYEDYRGLSMSTIAERLNVDCSVLFDFFNCKEELLSAVLLKGAEFCSFLGETKDYDSEEFDGMTDFISIFC
jgi:AcrR family transcriptional regulator